MSAGPIRLSLSTAPARGKEKSRRLGDGCGCAKSSGVGALLNQRHQVHSVDRHGPLSWLRLGLATRANLDSDYDRSPRQRPVDALGKELHAALLSSRPTGSFRATPPPRLLHHAPGRQPVRRKRVPLTPGGTPWRRSIAIRSGAYHTFGVTASGLLANPRRSSSACFASAFHGWQEQGASMSYAQIARDCGYDESTAKRHQPGACNAHQRVRLGQRARQT